MGENNLKKRIRNAQCREKIMSAEEAASFIRPGMTIGSSGFTPAGYPKMIPAALAKRAEAGEKLDLTLLTGASTGDEMDGVLARAGVIRRRIPYQTNKDLRDAINRGEISYMDMHLSQLPNWVKNGYLGKVHVAVVEATAIDENGNIVVTNTHVSATVYPPDDSSHNNMHTANTGDASNNFIWVLMLVVSVSGMVSILFVKRNRNR